MTLIIGPLSIPPGDIGSIQLTQGGSQPDRCSH